MRDELRYKIEVEPPMTAVLNQMLSDANQFGIEEDEVTRAMYGWVMARLKDSAPPSWLLQELDDLAKE